MLSVATSTLYEEGNSVGEVEMLIEAHDEVTVACILEPENGEPLEPETPLAVCVEDPEDVEKARFCPAAQLAGAREVMWQAYLKTK